MEPFGPRTPMRPSRLHRQNTHVLRPSTTVQGLSDPLRTGGPPTRGVRTDALRTDPRDGSERVHTQKALPQQQSSLLVTSLYIIR